MAQGTLNLSIIPLIIDDDQARHDPNYIKLCLLSIRRRQKHGTKGIGRGWVVGGFVTVDFDYCSDVPIMFLTRSEYDRGVNTFSPEGRLFQVEYAIEAIKLGSTTVGIRTPEGVVLGVEKRVPSPLLESSSVEKIMEIDSHLGCAMSGLTADARTMIDHARVTSQNHAFTYDEAIGVESVTQAVCDLALRFGESINDESAMMSRPFGVALLIAGVDEKGPQLYHTDPSGTYTRYEAKAIGSGSEAAQSDLQDKYHKQMTLSEAHHLVLRVLKQVMEEKLDHHNIQLAQVTKESGFKILSEDELQALIDSMPAAAGPGAAAGA